MTEDGQGMNLQCYGSKDNWQTEHHYVLNMLSKLPDTSTKQVTYGIKVITEQTCNVFSQDILFRRAKASWIQLSNLGSGSVTLW